MGGKVRQVLADGEHSERMKRRESFLLRFPDAGGTDGYEKFQMRCISALTEYYGDSEDFLADYMDICYLLGAPCRDELYMCFQLSNLCSLLEDLKIREESDLYLWMQVLERLLASAGRSDKQKKQLALKIAEALKLSGIGAALCRLEGGRYAFYPATEPFLDRALVFDVLGWLDGYPKAQEQYREALGLLLHGDRTRKALDCLRLSLELFCKQRYQNEKSLENQFSLIGGELADRGLSAELRKLYTTLLTYYAKFHNEHVKHDDSANAVEADFALYLTGSFLRLLLLSDRETL
ncbi:hypothetical protein [uncultured Anaerotruncus sp.]|uniref:hypothetical protein n=1 Tax=uncultured Anaerotruncus sp. TaxID=905011 RepID=UPI00280A62D8|nr:hypothetical protein [uncultured Anaerotruncus sp.]